MVMLMLFWDGEYGFSTMGVGAAGGNGPGIQGAKLCCITPGE